MGCGTAPCCGYVMPVTEENLKKLKISLDDLRAEYTEEWDNAPSVNDMDFIQELWDENQDMELVSNLLDEQMIVWLFYYDRESGDRYDDLQDGFYLSFEETCLYFTQETNFGEALRKNDTFPKFLMWTEFG